MADCWPGACNGVNLELEMQEFPTMPGMSKVGSQLRPLLHIIVTIVTLNVLHDMP